MQVSVQFFSYFKDLTGCGETIQELPHPATIDDLLAALAGRFPRWAGFRNCTLAAVGVEYQDRTRILRPGDEVSLFPPVQGG